jgi:GNAT superfamily N-acetyltransferase
MAISAYVNTLMSNDCDPSKPVLISTHDRITGTGAELLVIRGISEAANAGHLHGLAADRTDNIVIAWDADVAVAFVTFEEFKNGELWIGFGYCLPEYRRRGYYKACIERLREVARERGYRQIHTGVHPDNTSAKQSIEARGGRLHYLWYVFPSSSGNPSE